MSSPPRGLWLEGWVWRPQGKEEAAARPHPRPVLFVVRLPDGMCLLTYPSPARRCCWASRPTPPLPPLSGCCGGLPPCRALGPSGNSSGWEWLSAGKRGGAPASPAGFLSPALTDPSSPPPSRQS